MTSPLVQLLGTRADSLVSCIQSLGCQTEIIDKPEKVRPEADICLGSGVHYIIKKEYLHVPRLGIWGFHESALPKGRGCAPIQWAVLDQEPQLTVSFFQMKEEVDSGPLLGQASFPILKTDLLEDIRTKAMKVIDDLLRKHLMPFLRGELKPFSQQGVPTKYRKRNTLDSKLDMSKPLAQLWDLIRVCDNESYPAWFEMDGQKFILKRFKG